MAKKKLENLFKLSGKVTIYVPATVNVGEQVDNTEYVDETASLLSELFGGATSTPALGYWKSVSGQTIKEKTTLVFAYCSSEDLQQHIETVVGHCEYLRDTMTQESVALEINGEIYFV